MHSSEEQNIGRKEAAGLSGPEAESRLAESDPTAAMGSGNENEEEEMDAWFKYGVLVLYLEMAIATAVSIYSIYLAFTGQTGFLGH